MLMSQLVHSSGCPRSPHYWECPKIHILVTDGLHQVKALSLRRDTGQGGQCPLTWMWHLKSDTLLSFLSRITQRRQTWAVRSAFLLVTVRHLPTRPFNTGDGEMESEGDRQAHTRAHTHVHAHTQTLTHGSGVLGFLSWRLPALTVQLLCDVLIQSLWKNTGRCARVYTHPC